MGTTRKGSQTACPVHRMPALALAEVAQPLFGFPHPCKEPLGYRLGMRASGEAAWHAGQYDPKRLPDARKSSIPVHEEGEMDTVTNAPARRPACSELDERPLIADYVQLARNGRQRFLCQQRWTQT